MTRQPGAGGAAQLPLPLPPPEPTYDPAELLKDASNAEALAWLRRPADWPLGRLALWGEAKTGKTHLLRWAAARHGWLLLPDGGPALRGLPAPPAGARGLVLDDADRAAEEVALFHLINLAAERGLPLLLAGQAPPARWPVALPDLRSRLRGTAAVQVRRAGDALLAALLAKHFAERQLRVEPGFRAWLLTWLPRDGAAIAEAAARLDRAAMAEGGRLTRRLARAALAGLAAEEGAALAGLAAEAGAACVDDDSIASVERSSPAPD